MYSVLAVPFVTTYIGVFFWDFTPFLNFLENFLENLFTKVNFGSPHKRRWVHFLVPNIIWHTSLFILRFVCVNYTYRTNITLSDIVPDVSSYFPCVYNFILLPGSFLIALSSVCFLEDLCIYYSQGHRLLSVTDFILHFSVFCYGFLLNLTENEHNIYFLCFDCINNKGGSIWVQMIIHN